MAVTNMLKEYVDKATRAYILMHPELHSKDVKKEIQSIVKEKIVIPEATFAKQKTNLMGVIKYIEEQKPILSGYGTMFKQHDEYMSVEYDMVDDFAITRGVYKSKKFEHINDEDKVLFNMYDIFQLTFKLLNNSFYGVENQPDSFFYHPLLGPSITQTGVIIITTSLNLFEKVMSSNFSFRRFTDVITYVDNILQEEYDIEDYIDNDSMVDVDTFVEYIYSHCKIQTDKMRDKIIRLANNLSESELSKIYYKNNFYDFMNNSSDFTEVLASLLGNEDFLDPNKPPEEYMECLEYLWQVFNIVIHYNHLDFYRMDNAKYEKRKTILTVDTDSNFLYLYPFFEYCKEMSGIEDKDIYRVTTINIIMYILTSLITEHYEMLTSNFGIKDADKRKFISMKNEFFYSRIMLTESKKNYAGKVMIQEGKRLKVQKTDIKGLAIKKVNTNKIVREEYTKILENDILDADIIDSARAFQDYLSLQKRIKDSIQDGNIEFAIPGKVNALNSYKMPMQQQTVRGSVLWNDLYPNESIVFPDKINLVKLNPMKLSKESSDYEYDIICDVIDNDEQIDTIEKNRLKEVLKSTVYDNESYAHYGLKVICFPKSVKHLPSWLIPIIDVNTMIENNLSAGTKILKSLSLEVLSYQVGDNTGDVLSNHIINI